MRSIKDLDPKDMDIKKLRYIFNQILKRIEKKPSGFFHFCKMRKTRGWWMYGDMIIIDPRDKLVPTIIHEVLHDLYPVKKETWVYRVESKIAQILRPFDIYKLLLSTFSKMEMSKVKTSVKGVVK